MNTQERKHFWEALCSMNGTEQDGEILNNSIAYPKFLHRYRPMTAQSVDAMQQNRLYYSLPKYYDDPFDTLLKIDYSEVQKRIEDELENDELEKNLKQFCAYFQLPAVAKEGMLAQIRQTDKSVLFQQVKDELKKDGINQFRDDMWSICFCESGINEPAWIKYADQYRGFCLVYDLENEEKFICGKKEECVNCNINLQGASLYPVYYSDEKYDATEYAGALVMARIAERIMPLESAIEFIKTLPKNNWETEKVSLIKSKCHEYDQEWRMLHKERSDGPLFRQWIPYGVIIGLQTKEADRQMIIRTAKQAGIEHIFQLIITDDNSLDMVEIYETA